MADLSIPPEYPFEGYFYRREVNKSLPLNEREEREKVILRTKCDIHESERSTAEGFLVSYFKIYFPFDVKEGIKIKRGDSFRGNMYGLVVNGEVIGIYPSQLGGCEVSLKDYDV